MATKNIKKILLNKDGNKFVVDTENIVHSVNGVTPDEQGNVSITSVENATKATCDAGNNDIQSTYINKNDNSDVSGILNFTNGIKVQGYLLTIG